MDGTIRQLTDIHNRGYFVPSEDFSVERLPDGREKLHLLKKVKSGIFKQITLFFTVHAVDLFVPAVPLGPVTGDNSYSFTWIRTDPDVTPAPGFFSLWSDGGIRANPALGETFANEEFGPGRGNYGRIGVQFDAPYNGNFNFFRPDQDAIVATIGNIGNFTASPNQVRNANNGSFVIPVVPVDPPPFGYTGTIEFRNVGITFVF